MTVAIMQAVGGSEGMPLNRLFKQPEFWTAAVVSLLGISAPLVILYSGKFCWSTAVCLGWGVGNLLVIGWFVWRVGSLQIVTKQLERENYLEKHYVRYCC
ncbi:hypothetical protein GX441_12010 [bacterium]|nr:hypothetical protein [bacterium]